MKLFIIRQLFFAAFRQYQMRRVYATFRPTSQTRLIEIGGDRSNRNVLRHHRL